MTLQKRAYGRPLCYLLLTMAAGLVLYHSLAGGTLLDHSPYDSYSLLAQHWLGGTLYLPDGANRPWLELAIYNGRYYISFPPVPGVLALPWVLLCGDAAAVPSHLVVGLYGMAGAAGVYCLFARRGYTPAACVWWAAVCTAGSNLLWMSTNGGVWFAAQAANFALLAWGLCFAAGHTVAQNTAAAFCMALAVGCRPFSILVLAAYMLLLLVETGTEPVEYVVVNSPRPEPEGQFLRLKMPGAAFWLAFAAAAVVGSALAAYNMARFGSPLEFGHTYLPEFHREELGQFHPAYLWPNLLQLLRPVGFTPQLDLQFPVFNGFLFAAANPVFFWWFVRLAGKVYRRRFTPVDALALAGFGGGLLALCLHRTLGGWQFGARYTVDLIPFVLLAESRSADGARRSLRDWEWLLCALAVLFNAYGAVYMLSH